jgi:hypothetical protein
VRINYIVGIIILFAINTASFAGESDLNFRSKLYKRVEIQKIAKRTSYSASLTKVQKRALILSKNKIVNFLISLNKSDDTALNYLGSKYKKQFNSATAFYQNYFDAESLLAFEIYDFDLLNKNREIVIYAEIVEAAEGNEFIKPVKFYLTNIDGNLKINKMENLN